MTDSMTESLYSFEIVVPKEALDDNEHVNNVVYLEWIQRAAAGHAEASGVAEGTRQAGAVWVVVEHRIRYLKPAFLDDRVEIRTWVKDVRRAVSMRRTEIRRLEDGTLLAEGWTDWAFVDAATGKPKRIPRSVLERFQPIPG